MSAKARILIALLTVLIAPALLAAQEKPSGQHAPDGLEQLE